MKLATFPLRTRDSFCDNGAIWAFLLKRPSGPLPFLTEAVEHFDDKLGCGATNFRTTFPTFYSVKKTRKI